MNVRKQLLSGFTMIEILLSIAIVTLIAGMTAPIYQRLQVTNSVKVTSQLIAEKLRRAQQLSMAAQNDSQWGVYIGTGNIVIYKGSTYATRDQSFDETTVIPTSNNVSGITDLRFTKLTGLPSSTGFISVTQNTDSSTITINSVGTITIQ
ncbi:MAG: Tfp pilus assembly protein FimT/FimU [Weeksellaceae bacterium]